MRIGKKIAPTPCPHALWEHADGRVLTVEEIAAAATSEAAAAGRGGAL